ncbi:hypothetical protein HPB51_021838 [Rhipicephalus microplus]|uniref:Uncharacterized protein n=1 Tax=Rhipicephalus microplus TaxID=6941 RepID=A0A9J6E3E2_RHIMP|nr:hypothetical protein HPB51_021838 [Rhipicephalus microplus]
MHSSDTLWVNHELADVVEGKKVKAFQTRKAKDASREGVELQGRGERRAPVSATFVRHRIKSGPREQQAPSMESRPSSWRQYQTTSKTSTAPRALRVAVGRTPETLAEVRA